MTSPVEQAVEVVYASTAVVRSVTVALAPGATVADAIAASGLSEEFPALAQPDQTVGIFSRRCQLDTPVTAGDRVELYQPLSADPNRRRQQRCR